MTTAAPLSNRLRSAREERGWSQAELARRAGISRPEVSAIETGRLIPSTAAALAVAAALGVRVEEIFSLRTTPELAWEPGAHPARYWHAEVGSRRLRIPVEATPAGLLAHDETDTRTTEPTWPARTVVVAGCDPAVGILAGELLRQRGWRLLPLLRPSRAALALLAQGKVHFAGVHLLPNNLDVVRSTIGDAQLVRFADWELGVALAPTLRCRTVRSAVRANLRWVNRQPGAGARECLDHLFEKGRRPRGYQREASHHGAVAEAVRSGFAKAGICIRLVAAQARIGFLSMQRQSYDLCTTAALRDDPAVTTLIEVLRSSQLRQLVSDLPGYDVRQTGEIATVDPTSGTQP